MAYIAAAVVHLLLIGAFLFNFSNDEPRETINAFEAEKLDTVKASVIDESQIKDQQEKLKKAERERQRKTLDEKKRGNSGNTRRKVTGFDKKGRGDCSCLCQN